MERRELIYNAKTGEETIIVREMTEEEIALENERQAETQKMYRIAELKQKLSSTDYQAIKYAEGQLTAEDYAETKAQRQAWRDEINELQIN